MEKLNQIDLFSESVRNVFFEKLGKKEYNNMSTTSRLFTYLPGFGRSYQAIGENLAKRAKNGDQTALEFILREPEMTDKK